MSAIDWAIVIGCWSLPLMCIAAKIYFDWRNRS